MSTTESKSLNQILRTITAECAGRGRAYRVGTGKRRTVAGQYWGADRRIQMTGQFPYTVEGIVALRTALLAGVNGGAAVSK